MHDRPGLSDICEKILGKPLDETMQGSDWGRRPLMREQVMYAALDAYILIKIYIIMKSKRIRRPKTVTQLCTLF